MRFTYTWEGTLAFRDDADLGALLAVLNEVSADLPLAPFDSIEAALTAWLGDGASLHFQDAGRTVSGGGWTDEDAPELVESLAEFLSEETRIEWEDDTGSHWLQRVEGSGYVSAHRGQVTYGSGYGHTEEFEAGARAVLEAVATLRKDLRLPEVETVAEVADLSHLLG